MTQGIYQIHFNYYQTLKFSGEEHIIDNSVIERTYIGQSKNIEKRWYHHLYYLRKDKHVNHRLQTDFNKYGERFFFIKVLEVVSNAAQLSEREQYYIDLLFDYSTPDYYYNIKRYVNEYKPREISDITRERMRIASINRNKGRIQSKEEKLRRSVAAKKAYREGRANKGAKRGHGSSITTKEKYDVIHTLYNNGMKPLDIALKLDMNHHTVTKILYRYRKSLQTS